MSGVTVGVTLAPGRGVWLALALAEGRACGFLLDELPEAGLLEAEVVGLLLAVEELEALGVGLGELVVPPVEVPGVLAVGLGFGLGLATGLGELAELGDGLELGLLTPS